MTDLTDSFHKASVFAKKWGKSRLPDGRTVEDVLSIEGISLWNVVSPMLAINYISELLSRPSSASVLGALGRTIANEAKKISFDCKTRICSSITGCDHWPKNKTFLCLGFSPYIYRETLHPVSVRLSSRPESSVVVMDDLYSAKHRTAEHCDVNFQSVWQHWYPAINLDIRKVRKTLKKAIIQLAEPSGLQKIVEKSGFLWCDVKHIFNWLINVYLPRLLVYVVIAKHIVAHHRPTLILSPDVNDPRTRIFCLAGKLEGIKTLETQFSFYGSNDVEWDFFIADHLAVTGEQNLQVMLDHGIAPSKMTVTGSPRYDSTLSWPSELVCSIRKKLGVIDGKMLVLFASQPYYYGAFSSADIRREMIHGLFNAASNASGLVLIVKPHPLENPAELTSLLRGRRNILFADKHLDIRDLIKAADAFVTFFSSTTFDALVMNKPTINLAYPGGCANNLFEDCSATLVAKSDDEISCIFNSISTSRIFELVKKLSPARESFLNRWFYQLDGCAAERIESIALGMVAQNSTHGSLYKEHKGLSL